MSGRARQGLRQEGVGAGLVTTGITDGCLLAAKEAVRTDAAGPPRIDPGAEAAMRRPWIGSGAPRISRAAMMAASRGITA